MKCNFLKRAMCFVLALLMFTGVAGITTSAASKDAPSKNNGASAGLEDMRKYLNAMSYEDYLALYGGVAPGTTTVTGVYDSSLSTKGSYVVSRLDTWTGLGLDEEDYAGHENGVYLPTEGKVSFQFDVPDASGMFYIKINYYSINATVNSIERKLYIDDAVPFA
jgi:hypothetical protein